MIIAVIILILALVTLWVLSSVKNLSLKITGIVLIVLMLGATVGICAASPKLHKQFSINIIEYLIKINDDGSVSTTKQTTQTILHRQGTQK